jgi:hypothetical protein
LVVASLPPTSPMQRNRYNRYCSDGFQPLSGVFGPQFAYAFRQGLISAVFHSENHFPTGAVVRPQPNHPVELERLILAARTSFADRQILPERTRTPWTRRMRVVEQSGAAVVAEVTGPVAERRGTDGAESWIEELPHATAQVGDELAEHIGQRHLTGRCARGTVKSGVDARFYQSREEPARRRPSRFHVSVRSGNSHLRRWPVFYVSLVMSSILFLVTTLAVGLASNRKKAYGLCWLGLAFGIAPVCIGIGFPTYLLHALLVAIAATACLVSSRGPLTFFFASLTVFAGTYGY